MPVAEESQSTSSGAGFGGESLLLYASGLAIRHAASWHSTHGGGLNEDLIAYADRLLYGVSVVEEDLVRAGVSTV